MGRRAALPGQGEVMLVMLLMITSILAVVDSNAESSIISCVFALLLLALSIIRGQHGSSM